MNRGIFVGRSFELPESFAGENLLIRLSLFRLINESMDRIVIVHRIDKSGDVTELKVEFVNDVWLDANGEIFSFIDDAINLVLELNVSFEQLEPLEMEFNHG